jgi:hypothetical protein
MIFIRGKCRVGVKVVSWEVTHGVGWTVGAEGGGENRWVRRRETIGRGINNSVTAVCPVPSPTDSKGRCVGAGRGTGLGPLVETLFFFFTLRNGAPRLP